MTDTTAGGREIRRRTAGSRRRAATTPGRLRMLSTLIVTTAVVLATIGAGGLVAAGLTAVGVQQRTVPAILGMQRIHAWLADADRSAANAYLAGGSEITLPELQFQADIAAASRELQNASEHDPGGGDTSQRLQAISALVDQYVELVQTASVDDRQGVAAGTVYLQAGSGLMHRPESGILAQIDALRGLYNAGLDQARRTLAVTAGLAAVYAVVALALLVLLAWAQLFLRRRFHRRRNPRLLAATLLLLVVFAATGTGVVGASREVRTAEDQTYPRLLNLWTARALLYDANGSESLSMIAQATRGGGPFDQAFQAETRQLVDGPLTDDLVASARRGDVRFNGLLADELRTAASPAERAGAMQVLVVYRRFMDTDAAVRARVAQGDQAGAVMLALGTDRGQLTFAFADVDWYLGVVIQELQSRFDDMMRSAQEMIAATAAVQVLALAIAALSAWGLRPRIEEYRAGGPRPR